MKRVYSVRNSLDAHDARMFLEHHGVPARVANDNSVLEVGFSFTPASAPGVFVAEDDTARAMELIELFTAGFSPPTGDIWNCSACGQSVAGRVRGPLHCFRSEVGFGYASANFSAPAVQRNSPTPTLIAGGTGFGGRPAGSWPSCSFWRASSDLARSFRCEPI